MKKNFLPAAFWITAAATVITTILRVTITPQMQESETGIFKVSYLIIGFVLAVLIALAILTLSVKRRVYKLNELMVSDRKPISISAILLGLVLIVSSVFDLWQWRVFGITPPPNERVISNLDATTLTFTLIFGVLAGLFFIYLGYRLLKNGIYATPETALFALCPVIWIWVRIVRYEISYASAIPVEQSFYDFVMIIFTMLFLFSFSRYVTRIQEKESSNRILLFYSLCAALLSLSGPAAIVSLYMLGETEAYNSSRLAGLTDFCIGIFALSTAISLIFGRKNPAYQEEATDKTALDETAENTQIEEYTVPSEQESDLEQETAEEPLHSTSENNHPNVDEILEDLQQSRNIVNTDITDNIDITEKTQNDDVNGMET